MSEGSDAFRAAAGRFATGVTVLTTVLDGVDHAMTVSAFTSVSLDPPLVLVCVDRAARLHDAVLASGTWAVSMLPARMRALSDRFATRGRALDDHLAGVPYRPGPATGAPVLDGALAWLDCRTHAVHDGGDHSIVVGEVLALGAVPGGGGGESPLVFYRGAYGTFGDASGPTASPLRGAR